MRSFPEPWDLSFEEQAKVCNGIGPAKGSDWGSRAAWALSLPLLRVAEALGILDHYRMAGDQHDLLYVVGGTWEDKRFADGVFLGGCIHLSALWPIPLRPLGWALSMVFYLAVALGGAGNFHFRNYPRTLKEVKLYLELLPPTTS